LNTDKNYKQDFEDDKSTTADGKTKDSQDTKAFKKFNKTYKKPRFLEDDYDHLKKGKDAATIENTGYDIGDDEFLPDYFVQDAPTYKRNTVSINLPWLVNGAPEIDIQTRFLGEQVFSRMKVHKNECLEHLFKIYRAVLLSSQDRDFDFLEQYCEEMFFKKLKNRMN